MLNVNTWATLDLTIVCYFALRAVLMRQAEKKADEQRKRRERKRKKGSTPDDVCLIIVTYTLL